MLDLVREGEVAPSAELVAERAGVGRRTVFRLFTDMESVYAEMHSAMLERIEAIRATPIEGNTWRERLDQLILRRTRLFEEILPIKTAADAHRHRSPFLRRNHEQLTGLLRELLAFVLPKRGLDQTTREALDACLSIEMWRRLRLDQGLTASEAHSVLKRLVGALLD